MTKTEIAPSRDRWVPCPSRDELLAIIHAADDAASLLAWCMYASGLRQVRRSESRNRGLPMGSWVTQFVTGRHLVFLAKKITALYRGDIRRMGLSFPPRHGKSRMCTQLGPGWWLGKDPKARIVVCSYSERLALKSTRITRGIMGKAGTEVFGVTANERAAASDWRLYDASSMLETGGSVRGIGKTGGLTGDDVDFLCCDDLYKDAADASSPVRRQATLDWWESMPFTRMEPWTKGLVMGTRWHHEDVYGWLQERQEAEGASVGVPWEFLNCAAVCDTDDDPLGREPGEPLWPERFGSKFYDEIQADLKGSPRVWASLYQGRPSPADGDMFKREWFEYFVEGDDGALIGPDGSTKFENLVIYATIDLAFSTKTSADYTVCCVFGADLQQEMLYLLHLERDRVGSEGLAHWIRRIFDEWGVRRGFVERSGFHADITNYLLTVAKLPLKEIQPNTDKTSRAQPAATVLANGRLLFRSKASWVKELEAELMAFAPGCAHDDQVDALSHGVHVFNKHRNRETPAHTGYKAAKSGSWKIGR